MGVTDISGRLSQQFILKMLTEQIDNTQRQSTTGKKSTTVAGLGAAGASKAIGYRSVNTLLESYGTNLAAAKTKLTIIDSTMTSIGSSAEDMLSTLRKQLQDTAPQGTIISNDAKSMLQTVIQKLNMQHNGQYVFAGDDIYNQPINNSAALDTSMSALVAGWMAGSPTAGSVVTGARAVTGTGLGLNSGTLSAGNVTVRVDDNIDINYSQRADQDGYGDILRGLSIIANLPQPTTQAEQDNYWAIVNGAITLLDEGSRKVDTYQANNGINAKQVDALIAQHEDSKLAYEQLIGDVEDVDMAEAAMKFQSLSTQLQTSYSMIGTMRNLSLINYL